VIFATLSTVVAEHDLAKTRWACPLSSFQSSKPNACASTGLVELLPDEDVRQTEHERPVGGGFDRNPLVGLGCRHREARRDLNNFARRVLLRKLSPRAARGSFDTMIRRLGQPST
jgi:hypothetical protein